MLRCVVTRVLDARGQKILAQSYLLSNLGSEVSAQQLAQWQGWAAEADPCFRLLRQGVQLIGGMGELGDPDMMKRLLIAGQVGTTVWRLLQAEGEWADRTRMLLNQLTGPPGALEPAADRQRAVCRRGQALHAAGGAGHRVHRADAAGQGAGAAGLRSRT